MKLKTIHLELSREQLEQDTSRKLCGKTRSNSASEFARTARDKFSLFAITIRQETTSGNMQSACQKLEASEDDGFQLKSLSLHSHQ